MSDKWQPNRRTVLAGLTVSATMTSMVSTTASAAAPPEAATRALLPGSGKYGDPLYTEAYIDADEWRDQPRRYRYVHGGFKGTDLRFSGYFPEKEKYRGRFFQSLAGGFGGNEHSVIGLDGRVGPYGGGLGAPFDLGGYVIESNQGHLGDMAGLKGDGTVLNYRANAATARYMRTVAAEMYGSAPKYGYAYGGGGGSIRVVKGLENVPDLWQGGIADILPVPGGNIPTTMNALRVLGDKLDQVIDAVEPGGSGNPFEGLSYRQRDALAKLYRSGYPRGGEYLLPTLVLTHNILMEEMRTTDPTYFTDFWTKPGYIGFEEPSAIGEKPTERTVRVKQVLQVEDISKLTDPDPAGMKMLLGFRPDRQARVGIRVDGLSPSESYRNVRLRIGSGAAKGREMFALGSVGDILLVTGPLLRRDEISVDPFKGVAPGDEVTIDNRDFLATCFYGEYQVAPGYADTPMGWEHSVNGMPIQPQRKYIDLAMNLQPDFTGRYEGKLIVLQHAHDAMVPPIGAETYKRMVQRAQGAEAADHRLRLWWIDRAHHIPVSSFLRGEDPGVRFTAKTRLIDTEGAAEEALHHLVAWVERGTNPPPNSRYEWRADNGLTLIKDPAAAGGIQPMIDARVGNGKRVTITAGQPVVLSYRASMPKGSPGKIVDVSWDFDGSGTFAAPQAGVPVGGLAASGSITHVFDKPGTYFPSVRVRAQRNGDPKMAAHGPANLDLVRVVVT